MLIQLLNCVNCLFEEGCGVRKKEKRGKHVKDSRYLYSLTPADCNFSNFYLTFVAPCEGS